ncbi:unnamed protein product, partial [Heterosigma akashiwo]
MDFLSFKPEMFFFLLLPPIIFEAGYTLRKKQFFSNFGSIIFFAVFGTLLSTFIVGGLTFMLGKVGKLVDIDSNNPMEPLIFGALISAVDPVATLSILGTPELNCDPLLYSLVFGESVLNDAVAIVLFKTFQEVPPASPASPARFALCLRFLFACIEIQLSCHLFPFRLGCSYFCKHSQVREYPKYEIALLFLFSYGSYAFAESIELSGIMALFFCGIVLSHYNSYNLSQASQQITAEYIFASLGHISELFVFLYMGMGFFTGRYVDWNLFFSFAAICFCLIARAAHIFPFSFLANLGRYKIEDLAPMQCAGGSRGRGGYRHALVSMNMPKTPELYTTTTLSVVIFTTVVCGGLTEPALDRLGMKTSPAQRLGGAAGGGGGGLGQQGGGLLGAAAAAGEWQRGLQRSTKRLQRGIHGAWRRFDDKFMKPLFGGA